MRGHPAERETGAAASVVRYTHISCCVRTKGLAAVPMCGWLRDDLETSRRPALAPAKAQLVLLINPTGKLLLQPESFGGLHQVGERAAESHFGVLPGEGILNHRHRNNEPLRRNVDFGSVRLRLLAAP